MDTEEITKEEETVEEESTTVEETEEGEKQEVKKFTEPRLARVEYDYEARESDELSLNKGDVITVLEQNEGWWKGDLHGKAGIFPANHVKLIEVPTQSTEDGEDSENPEGIKKKTLNKYGVKTGGLGSLFSGGVPTLKKRSHPPPENPPPSEERHVIASPPVLKKTSVPSPVNQQPSSPLPNLPPKKKPPKPKKVEPNAEVLFEYEAEEDNEISLIPGTFITILEKTDDGWWSGRNEQGKVGLFPSTYIREIKQSEVQQKSQSVSEEATVEVERHESSETPATISQEVFTSEPVPVSADSPPPSPPPSTHSSSHETQSEDSPTLPKSPSPPVRRTTNETSSPPTPNRRSTHESSQATPPKRRSTHEPTSPTSPRKNSSHDGEEHVTSKRPPSLVSPDLPPIQFSTNFASTDTSPISPKERPTAPPRQLSRPLSSHENKTDSQKSPTLTKPSKSFSPAKPPVISPVKRSSSSASKSDKTKNDNSPIEPVSPKVNRRTSYDQHDSLTETTETTEPTEPTESTEPENKDYDHTIDDDEKKEVVENLEAREEADKEAEISDGEEKDDEVTAENLDTKEDDDTTGGHEVEPEEKKPQPQLPPLPSGPKLSNLQKDRPAIKNRKAPSVKSVKENASQSQTAILTEAVASAKDEVEQKPASPPTPPKPEKPEKPVKPNSFKLPTLGTGVQLRSVAKKPPIETSTESTENTSSTTSSGIDTKPISGGVKGISSRFNQFGGIPNSSDVEFRLKKWFNEEINKVKSNFEAKLAEERSKREALEEEIKELVELVTSLQEN